MSVDFDFTQEQYALRDMARDLFEKESSPARLRELWNGAERDARTWKMLAEVGILGLAVPEKHGGSGGTMLDLVLVLEEAGRSALPGPFVETAAIAAPTLDDAGLQQRLATGDLVVSVGVDASPFVLDADVADALLLQRGDEVHLVMSGDFSCKPARSIDLARRIFTIDDVETTTLVSHDAQRMLARAAVATAAVLNGIGMRLVEMTQSYVASRKQFGKPVGSFQAVQHKLADMHVAVESSRPLAWYAAYADTHGLPDAVTAAHAAKAHASETSKLVNQEALQCHGGIGFTWEHDLHLWLKRAKALENAYGTATEHRAAIARGLFDA